MAVSRIEQITNTPYSFEGLTEDQKAKRKERQRHVAEGVGITGAVSYQARQYATKKALVNNMMENVSNAARLTSKNAKEASTLFGKFRIDVRNFTKGANRYIAKFQNMKFIGPIVKSPLMRGACSAFGFTMAAFALVTGVSKAVENGKLAVGDLQSRFNRAA